MFGKRQSQKYAAANHAIFSFLMYCCCFFVLQLHHDFQPCNVSLYILCYFLVFCSYVYTLSLATSLLSFSVGYLALCRFIYTLSLGTSLHIFSVGFLALCNCIYAFSLAHCLNTEQDLVLLSLLFFCCHVKLLLLPFLGCMTYR
jgi:hypothetical protein